MQVLSDAEFSHELKKHLLKCAGAINPDGDNTRLLKFIIKLSNSLIELNGVNRDV